MRIAILEDDKELAKLYQLWLDTAGHSCTIFLTRQSFIKFPYANAPKIFMRQPVHQNGIGAMKIKRNSSNEK